jgi:glycosyltransferase involved in cell wall biosynthesis
MGVKIHGAGSPDGLVQHWEVPSLLRNALAYVHLKSSDSPGYSLYEALAAGCPVVCTRRLIWRSRMQELFSPGETCLAFDRETHDGLTEQDVAECTSEVAGHLERLRDPAENARIGMAGHRRLREVMWDAGRPEDVASLREFMRRHFGG